MASDEVSPGDDKIADFKAAISGTGSASAKPAIGKSSAP